MQGARSVTTSRPFQDGRVALVTGGGAGIGRAIVRALASDGYVVVVADVRDEVAKEVALDVRSSGGQALAMRVDLTSPESIAALFGEVDREVGRCDVLVNNAGFASIDRFADLSIEVWMKTLAVNLTAPMLMAQRAVLMMKCNNWGRIVNVASVSGLRAGVGRTAYGTSKAGLMGLTRQMAIELASANITVNAVAPGPIDTEMAAVSHSAETVRSYYGLVPLRRYGTPEEVANAVVFLCSDNTAYVTGHTLLVDGGFMAAGVLEI